MPFKRNTASIIHFVPINVNDGTALTTGSASAYFVGAGGGSSASSAATSNNPTHKGNGIWELQLTSTEMDFEVVTVRPIITDMIPQFISIDTVSKLVSELSDFDAGASAVNVRWINGITVNYPSDLMANTSALSTFDASTDFVTTGTNTVRADIRKVLGLNISSINDFKADTGSITAAFAGTTVLANIVEVNGVSITDISDFYTSTVGLSTFDYTNPNHKVALKDNSITSNVLDSTGLTAISNNMMAYHVDGNGTTIPYVNLSTVTEMLLAWMSGQLDVVDNGNTRTFTFYKRGGTAISWSVTASEQDSYEGQRSSQGNIGS